MLSTYFQLKKYPEFNSQLLRKNLQLHIYEGSLFLFALSFMSVYTVLPVFIQRIGGNPVAVSLVTVLWSLGLNLPQLFFIRFFHKKERIKPDVLRSGLIYRISFIIISFVCSVFIQKLDSSVSVPLMLFLILIAAVAGSSSGLFWYDLFSKTTPVKLRGRLLSIRLLAGSALGIIGGSAVSVILANVVYPHNFALLFLIGFFLTMISFYFLTGLKEPVSEADNPELSKIRDTVPVSLKEIIVKSKKILKENTGFRNFIIVDALIQMTLSAAAFYPVYAVNKFDLPTSYAGTFTIIFMASQVFGNFIFGYLADYFGHKINIIILTVFSAAAGITAVISDNVLLYGAVFFFVGSIHTLQGISRVALVVEMCNESERPVYIGLLNTITAPMVLFGVIAGTLVTIVGFVPVFLIYSLISFIALYRLHKYVAEPRKIKNII